MEPYFSVIIPLYNKASHIGNTLGSVFNQIYRDFEIIIVNDGSTDNSLEVVKKFKDERLKIFTTENKGVSHARNYGVKQSSSNLIAFLDADDIWTPSHLNNLEVLREDYPDCGMYCIGYQRNIKGKIVLCRYNTISSKQLWSGVLNDFFDASMRDNIATSSSVMVPKNVFESIGNFNESYNSGEDTDFWIRVALKYSVAFSNKVSVTINWYNSDKLNERLHYLKNYFDINAFEDKEIINNSLKRYLDQNRLSTALQYKISGNYKQSKYYSKDINTENLNATAKLALLLPSFILKSLFNIRNLLRNYNIDLRLFR